VFILAAGLLLSCLILGGATSYGYLSEALLQLASIPVLLAGIWYMLDHPPHRQARWALIFCLTLVLVPLIQLIPLPPGIWTNLPGRDVVASTMKLTFPDLPWMPLSLSPRSTWLGLLALLPPLAIFLIVQQLGYQARRHLSFMIIATGVISVFLGLLQLMQGPESSLRFFDFTNLHEAVGFFANRNHYAALLYSILLFTAAWILAKLADPAGIHTKLHGFDTARIFFMLVGFTLIVVFIAGILMARSRAGLGLTILAFIGIYLMSQTGRGSENKNRSTKLIWAGMALTLMFASQFALFRIMDRLGTSISGDLRVAFAQVTTKALWDTMPFGTGIGSFVPTFKLYETTADMPGYYYANHAHNDFLEAWLETGGVGLLILALFIAGYLYRTFKIWRTHLSGGRDIDHMLAKAATIIILLLLLHSLVDYPLRTTAMLSIMTFACALLIEPPLVQREQETADFGEFPRKSLERKRQKRGVDHQTQTTAAWPKQTAIPAERAQKTLMDQPFWKDVEWPEEWRKSSDKRPKENDEKP